MANKKKNQKKKNGKNGNRSRPTTTMPSSKVVSRVRPTRQLARKSHVTSVCSITDPFCIHAKGAQRPDGGPPSIPFQIRAVVTQNAYSATGGSKATYGPNVGFGYLGAALVSSTYTNSATWATTGGDGFVTGNAKEVRITSFGVVVRSAMTATTAKGLIILSTDPAPVPGGTTTAGSMQATESQVTTLAAGTEIAWVSKPLGPSAHLFRPISDYTNSTTNLDWTSCVVEIVGGDTTSNTPYVTVEYVLNVEFTVVTGSTGSSAVGMLQRAPPPPNRAALAAAERVHATTSSFISGGIDAASRTVERYASSALETILSEGMALLFA